MAEHEQESAAMIVTGSDVLVTSEPTVATVPTVIHAVDAVQAVPAVPAAAAVPKAVSAPIVAATWTEKEPGDAWCPDSLREALPWAAGHAYAHEVAVRLAGTSPWEVTGATRRGRVHAHAGEFREDAMAVHAADDLVLAIVADGAGSARYSRVGAEHVCLTVRETVTAAWGAIAADAGDADALATALGGALGDGVAQAAVSLRALAASVDGVQPRDFRCTVIAAAWGRVASHEALVAVQVGDGVAATLDVDGTVTRIGAGDSGSFSGEVTCFVPDEESEARARVVVRMDPARVQALLVATDGIEDPFYPIAKRGADVFRQLRDGNEATLEGFVRQPAHGPVFGAADGAESLASWLQFEKRGENDDRTIVALARSDRLTARVAG